MACDADSGFLALDDQRLDYRWFGPRPDAAPTLVLLHEGLGSVALWGEFPKRLSQATGCGVFAYSRQGYGRSSPVPLPRPLDFMHREARETLPKVLDAIGFRRGLLVGHSDGASIAAIYAGSVPDRRVTAIALMAPHFIIEDITLAAIRDLRAAYDTTDLRERLARHHDDGDATVRGWSDVWLNHDVSGWDITDVLKSICVPVLVIQGEGDQFGTERQPQLAQQLCGGPVEVAMLPQTRHVPFREAPEQTLALLGDFVRRSLRSAPSR